MSRHYIVYSHGFGVRKDDRGLFSDIADAFPNAQNILFDYNDFNEVNGTMTVQPISRQVDTLKATLRSLNITDDDVVDIIAHSQGCIVAAAALPQNIRNTIFLAPPSGNRYEELLSYFSARGAIDTSSESTIPRRDGTTTIVPAAFWSDLKQHNAIELFSQLSQKTKLSIISAQDDEVLGTVDFSMLDVPVLPIAADHDFNGNSREIIIAEIKERLPYEYV